MSPYAPTQEEAFRNTTETISKASKTTNDVRLGYLEFDDQGELWRYGRKDGGATQLSVVLNDLRSMVNRGPVKTIVFIHGWNNDASDSNMKSGNLGEFRKSLVAISKSCNTPVYGVYVSWRGSTFGKTIGIDVWDRDAAAGRIAGPTMLTSLQALSNVTHDHPASRVIMIGHSFGGKILAKVASYHLASEIGKSPSKNVKSITPLADTTIVVNSATNSPEMRQVAQLMNDFSITYKRHGRNVPLFVTVASSSDHLVKCILPVYLRINRDLYSFPDRGGHVVNQSQSDSLYNAMGFNPQLVNHELVTTAGEPAKGSSLQLTSEHPATHSLILKNLANGSRSRNHELPITLLTSNSPTAQPPSSPNFKIIAKPTERPDYVSPYWGVNVPDLVIKGHSDLWNPNFIAFVSAVEGMSRQPGVGSKASPTSKAELKVTRPLDAPAKTVPPSSPTKEQQSR